jgi:hypothetical protein
MDLTLRQQKNFDALQKMDRGSPEFKIANQKFKEDTFVQRYSGGPQPLGPISELQPWQQEFLDRLAAMDIGELEARIAENTRGRSGKSQMINIIHSMDAQILNGMGIRDTHIAELPYHYGTSFQSMWIDDRETFVSDERGDHDWEQKTFVSGPSTPPSEAKRAKLRAKRKKRK